MGGWCRLTLTPPEHVASDNPLEVPPRPQTLGYGAPEPEPPGHLGHFGVAAGVTVLFVGAALTAIAIIRGQTVGLEALWGAIIAASAIAVVGMIAASAGRAFHTALLGPAATFQSMNVHRFAGCCYAIGLIGMFFTLMLLERAGSDETALLVALSIAAVFGAAAGWFLVNRRRQGASN
jgi:hypothetical protein